jgi:hypothetical protein
MKSIFLIIIAGSLTLFASCKKDELQKPPHSPCQCEYNIICTEQYAMLSISLVNQNGEPQELDKIISTKIDGGQSFEFTFGNQFCFHKGDYSFWSDSQLKETKKGG